MKKDLASIELHYLCREFQGLLDAKINNIYQAEDSSVYLVFHKASVGKKILRITQSFIYLSKAKDSQESPTGFCQFLRKYLHNCRLRAITQIASERILQLDFETKEGNYQMMIELFGQSNIILCKDSLIVGCLKNVEEKERKIAKGENYKLPKSRINLFELAWDEFFALIKDSSLPIVKFLASELGIGGLYAEELCLLAGVDKKTGKATEAEAEKLFMTFEKMLAFGSSANIVLQDGILDIVPFKMKLYANKETEDFDTFSEALDHAFPKTVKKVDSKLDKEIKKYENILEAQQSTITKLEREIAENSAKGTKIYESFQVLDEVLKQSSEARKKIGLKAMKEHIKDNGIIKDVKQDGKIIVELK